MAAIWNKVLPILVLAALPVACLDMKGLKEGAADGEDPGSSVTPSDGPVLGDAAAEEPAPTDAGGPDLGDASRPKPQDEKATPAQACATPKDLTGDDDDSVAFSVSPTATPVSLAPPCVRVRRGKPFRFGGDFVAHPLEVVRLDGKPVPTPKGKEEPNSVRIDEEGTFEVRCPLHPSVETAFVVVVP